MIKTRKSGAKYSAIVAISEDLKKQKEEGKDILFLNRGINSVVNIDLSKIIPMINFNSDKIQVYPPNAGSLSLRKAISESFFLNTASTDNIFITNGGISALDLVFKTLDVEKVWLPSFFWGAYKNILTINKIKFDFYENIEFIENNIDKFKDSAIIFCDPNNTLGNKLNDDKLLALIKQLNENDTVAVWDSPYRKLFFNWDDDDFYKKLIKFNNVIITESFSKSVGLSGQRLGFIHCNNQDFKDELKINLLFATNGINAFSQNLVEKLLTTKEGQIAVDNFKRKTVTDIQKNIQFLIDNKLLASEFYNDEKPIGIFVIVNKSYDELLEYGIGSVPLNYFSTMSDDIVQRYSRICVSVPNTEFVKFFSKLIGITV